MSPFSALKLVLSVALAHGQLQDKPSIVVNGAVCLNEPVLQFINGFQGQAHSSAVRGSPENKKGGKPQERKTVLLLGGKERLDSDGPIACRLAASQ